MSAGKMAVRFPRSLSDGEEGVRWSLGASDNGEEGLAVASLEESRAALGVVVVVRLVAVPHPLVDLADLELQRASELLHLCLGPQIALLVLILKHESLVQALLKPLLLALCALRRALAVSGALVLVNVLASLLQLLSFLRSELQRPNVQAEIHLVEVLLRQQVDLLITPAVVVILVESRLAQVGLARRAEARYRRGEGLEGGPALLEEVRLLGGCRAVGQPLDEQALVRQSFSDRSEILSLFD